MYVRLSVIVPIRFMGNKLTCLAATHPGRSEGHLSGSSSIPSFSVKLKLGEQWTWGTLVLLPAGTVVSKFKAALFGKLFHFL